MTTGYQIKDQDALYYLTIQVVDWVDVFTRQAYRDIVLESLAYCQTNKGLQVFGYVIMSNHVHLIANSTNGNLSDVIRDFKKFTSKQILDAMQQMPESRREWMLGRFSNAAQQHSRNRNYQFWTHENHAVHLYSPAFTAEKLQYLHNNPVRAQLVQHPEDYLYSSARNYASLPTLFSVILLDLPWKTQ